MPFRVALSADFLTADGSPAYPMFDLSPLDAAGVEYEYVDLVESEEGMTEAMTVPASSVEGFDALILLAAAFTEDSIPSDGRLALVARFGVGFDNVDVDACTAAGIATTITPDGVRRPVAVTVINFMLNLASKLRAKERLARTDDWASRSEYMGVGITDKTLGLLGIGNIGAEICRLIEPFDVNVIAYDPFVDASTAAELGSPPPPLCPQLPRGRVSPPNNDKRRTTTHAPPLATEAWGRRRGDGGPRRLVRPLRLPVDQLPAQRGDPGHDQHRAARADEGHFLPHQHRAWTDSRRGGAADGPGGGCHRRGRDRRV